MFGAAHGYDALRLFGDGDCTELVLDGSRESAWGFGGRPGGGFGGGGFLGTASGEERGGDERGGGDDVKRWEI